MTCYFLVLPAGIALLAARPGEQWVSTVLLA